ncbi:probable 2-oxoglutarate-dependent dioxygenase SLC1 [Zingiber officinale]|uniref:Fe2OG dioxygenase domain-containing protein n=1 Tax=Zingiber officinale TaxID=94328 RepID=A0A8J5I000_ZINOF|nr:probable 2-oxoglutarate-dependent dioxygenase SLC1 [Zingiber officinale]KAG6530217.1 hypothetical protein ZIOFF_012440 [Zingiber officinale]
MGLDLMVERNTSDQEEREEEEEEKAAKNRYTKGVKHLLETGISSVPKTYILPPQDRPRVADKDLEHGSNFRLPVIDMARLRSSSAADRIQALEAVDKACKEYGFFQVVNHGMNEEGMRKMMAAGRRFFEQGFEERKKWMTSDIRGKVRYGTSFNEINDTVLCWRDFLKLNCQPLQEMLPLCPSSPKDLRDEVVSYVEEIQVLFLEIMAVVLEALGVRKEESLMEEFEEGSHMLIVNYFPPCPNPDLTLGMPPHSDYGFLTLLLQDDIAGLQVYHRDRWFTIDPLFNSIVVNIGDHLEIFSNGRYKSVLHRVLVNSTKPRMSIASLHSLPFSSTVRPAAALIDDAGRGRLYKDTDFAAFLNYISSHDANRKSFLETRKLTPNGQRG